MSDPVRARESNFELLRIVAMVMVLVGHVNGIAFQPLAHSDAIDAPCSSFLRLLLGQACVVAVNVFILISGYFSIRIKQKSVLNFVYIIVFWRLLTYFGQVLSGDAILSLSGIVSGINPLKIWFVRDYVTLMLFAPVLNAFVERQGVNELARYLVVFYTIVCVGDFVIPLKLWGVFSAGYSFLWFAGVYLLGRLIRVRVVNCLSVLSAAPLKVYLCVTLLATLLMFVTLYLKLPTSLVNVLMRFCTAYSSPFVVCGAVALLVAFSKVNITSRLVNHMAMSVFAVYLIHSPTQWFWRCVRDVHANYGGWVSTYVFTGCVFVLAILIDQLRIASWRGLCWVCERKS